VTIPVSRSLVERVLRATPPDTGSGGSPSQTQPPAPGKNPRFSRNGDWIEKAYKLGKGAFHEVKRLILTDAGRKLLQRVGDNPNIGIDENGVIWLQSQINGLEVPTDLLFRWYLP